MNRLTVNKPVEEMGMYELAHNSCFAKNGEAYYRDFDREISARDFARELYKAYSVYEPAEDNDELDEALMDDLAFHPAELPAGLIALFYRNLWAMADLYERLKSYEIYDERNVTVAHAEKTNRWIPVDERLPENSDYVLLSFANCSDPLIGRYEQQEDGSGNWYLGDCDEEDTCLANDLFVNAWMPLPVRYEEE